MLACITELLCICALPDTKLVIEKSGAEMGSSMSKKHPVIKILRSLVRLFTPRITTSWEVPYDGEPAVFVANHDRARGPLAMCAHFSLCTELRPWIIARMMNIREVPEYVRQDFWWKQGRWYTKLLDHTLPYPIALILPPVFHGVEGIPVYHDSRVVSTFKESIRTLNSGKNVALFPERAEGFGDYSDNLNSGFLLIAKSYYKKTGKALNFYPVYVDWDAHTISVARPIQYNPSAEHSSQSKTIIDQISSFIVR